MLFLETNGLIYSLQSGFRPSFSTDSALIHLSDLIRQNMDKGLYTGALLLDLQKAFDTVNHSILLSKFQAMGMNKSTVTWFKSYLSQRKQFVDISGTRSPEGVISCGVPQGSILGPLMFLVYVNDMNSATSCKLFLYADDSVLVTTGKDLTEIERTLSSELQNIQVWLEINKLSLHLGKTESIVFGSKQKLKRGAKIQVKCKDTTIVNKDKIKYLGITLDQDMSGVSQGNSVIQKINGNLKFLYRKCFFLSQREKKMVCSALLQASFDYGCNIWYRGLKSILKKKLQTAQNKMMRFILGFGSRHHISAKDFTDLDILNLAGRMDYLTVAHFYDIYHGTAPSYLRNAIRVADVHSHNTRNSSLNFMVPAVKSQGKLEFMFNGIKVWNALPDEVKLSYSKPIFKRKVKSHFLYEMGALESESFIFN